MEICYANKITGDQESSKFFSNPPLILGSLTEEITLSAVFYWLLFISLKFPPWQPCVPVFVCLGELLCRLRNPYLHRCGCWMPAGSQRCTGSSRSRGCSRSGGGSTGAGCTRRCLGHQKTAVSSHGIPALPCCSLVSTEG